MFNKNKEKAQLLKDYRFLFNLPEGKRVLKHILEACHVLDQSLSVKSTDEILFKEGQRSVALMILRNLSTDADKLQQLMEERENERIKSISEQSVSGRSVTD